MNKFYLTDDLDFVRKFIDKYQVSYIIVGRLEKAFTPAEDWTNLKQAGILWDQVFQYDSTVVYKVSELGRFLKWYLFAFCISWINLPLTFRLFKALPG